MHLQPRLSLFWPPFPVVPSLYHTFLRRLPCLIVISVAPPQFPPIPVTPSGGPLRPPPHWRWWATVGTPVSHLSCKGMVLHITPHPPACTAIWSLSQYMWRRRRALVPTPYTYRMDRHLDISKASYALCRSRKIDWRTTSLMAETCWSSFTSRFAVPVKSMLYSMIWNYTKSMTCFSPRRPLFIHTLSFECTSKLCINFLNQFSFYFHI